MKKFYKEPEIEVKKFSFSEIMLNLQDSNPEDYEDGGFDLDIDDIG